MISTKKLIRESVKQQDTIYKATAIMYKYDAVYYISKGHQFKNFMIKLLNLKK